MIEPSLEAVVALCDSIYESTGEQIDIHHALAAALPIERNRWEQEVRERLEAAIRPKRWIDFHAEKAREAEESGDSAAAEAHRAARDVFEDVQKALGPLFGEAEPVEGERNA